MNIRRQAQNSKDAISTYQNDCPKIQDKTFKKLIKLLEKDEWILDMGVYSSLNIKSIAPFIIETSTIQLWLGYNARPQLLLEITQINFPQLKELSLAHNQIHSLEAISFLNFPKLEEIQFRQNVITSIHVFKKLNLPQLKVVSFYRNYVKETISVCLLKSKNLKNIWIQYQDDEQVQCESLTFLSKLQSPQLKGMTVASMQRIRQPLVQRSLLEKYQNLKIYSNTL